MDSAVRQKLDRGLAEAVRAYEESAEYRNVDAAISVNVRFEGDIAAIEALGFEVHCVTEDQALGVIRFRDIARVALHPNVVSMSAGMEPSPDLDTAVADGRVRASSTGSVGTGGDGLWHADVASGTLTAAANATGAGVIVAILDTGIDFTHPSFMSQLTPSKKTRIKRIWDQGLKPGSLAECPDVSLLVSANTYGVEYKNDAAPNDFIDQALNGGTPLLHKDCEGHGTHVAGIAAGGVLFPSGGSARFVGVAPEADIIMVKLLDVPANIKFRLASGFGADVPYATRFRDAVIYCLRTAAAMGKPIVINMSFGNVGEPGDGLDDDARWVDARLDPSASAGPLQFPSGAIVVKSSGNNGNVTRRRVATIKVPSSGEVIVPLEVKDDRVGVNTKFKTNTDVTTPCKELPHKPDVRAVFWYRRNFDVVKFALKLPNRTSFGGDMGIGGWEDHSFVLRSGPPRTVFTSPSPRAHRIFAEHTTDAAVPHPDSGNVRRHSFAIRLTPKVSGGTVSYAEGTYEVRIKAPESTELFLSCSIAGFSPGNFVQFRLAGGALPAGVVASADFSSVDTLGRHVITVASYDDTDGVTANPLHHHIAASSSRGPLRDFSDPPGSLALVGDKPDVAAPGEDITSAESADTKARPVIPSPDWLAGVRFVPKSGTSMATPFIVGLVALMLDKTSTLTVAQVRTALRHAAAGRPGVDPPAPGTAHDRAYGAGMVDGLKAHDSTP